MLRILFISTIIFSQLAFASTSLAIVDTGKSEEDIMKEINDILLNGPDETEEFEDDDVEIDLESLGLDNVDEDTSEVLKENIDKITKDELLEDLLPVVRQDTVKPKKEDDKYSLSVIELEKNQIKENKLNESQPIVTSEKIKTPKKDVKLLEPLPNVLPTIDPKKTDIKNGKPRNILPGMISKDLERVQNNENITKTITLKPSPKKINKKKDEGAKEKTLEEFPIITPTNTKVVLPVMISKDLERVKNKKSTVKDFLPEKSVKKIQKKKPLEPFPTITPIKAKDVLPKISLEDLEREKNNETIIKNSLSEPSTKKIDKKKEEDAKKNSLDPFPTITPLKNSKELNDTKKKSELTKELPKIAIPKSKKIEALLPTMAPKVTKLKTVKKVSSPISVSEKLKKLPIVKVTPEVSNKDKKTIQKLLPTLTTKKTILPRKKLLEKNVAKKKVDKETSKNQNYLPIVEKGGSLKAIKKKTGTISKIQNFLKNAKKNVDLRALKTEKEKLESNKKNKKIKDIKKITESEKKQIERLKELNKLRNQYLIKIDSEDSYSDDEYSNDTIKIIPIKREINKYSLYKVPPPPISDNYRTEDNLHIPTVTTQREKLGILFKTITDNDDISYFKSAYNTVRKSNARNLAGDTILTYSILLQRHSVVASILSLGANPNMANSLGYVPLGIAIEIRDPISLKLLVNNNAKVDYVDAFGRTYLMHAARVGFLPAVSLLISKGVDVNAMDSDGFTALSIAYRHKKDVIIKFLLKHGAKTWVEKPYDSSSQSLIKELNYRWKK